MEYRTREMWLAGMSRDEFAGLCPWEFMMHPESVGQWEAEFSRAFRLRRYSRDELISLLSCGLHALITRTLKKHIDAPPEKRGAILIGSCIQYVRTNAVVDAMRHEREIFPTVSLDGLVEEFPRTHGLQNEYSLHADSFKESLQVTPQYLGEGVVLEDEIRQVCHASIENIRVHLEYREHQFLRLLLVERLDPCAIAEVLHLSIRQVWKIRRATQAKLERLVPLDRYRDALTRAEHHLICSAVATNSSLEALAERHNMPLSRVFTTVQRALDKMRAHDPVLFAEEPADVR